MVGSSDYHYLGLQRTRLVANGFKYLVIPLCSFRSDAAPEQLEGRVLDG